MPRMRGRLYSSCASSTWSFPSALTACWAKMSRISCVRSTTRASSAFSSVALLRRVELVVDQQARRPRSRRTRLQLLELALADVRARVGPGALLARARPTGLDAGGARQLARARRAPSSASAPCGSTASTNPRSGSAPGVGSGWRGVIAAIMPRVRSVHGIDRRSAAARTLELVDIPSPEPARGARSRATSARRVPLRAAPTTTDESLLCAQRRAAAARRCSPATRHRPGAGNLPGRIEDGAVHGLGASDMKGGARRDDRARALGLAERPCWRTTSALLLLPARGDRPAESPLPGVFEGSRSIARGGARGPARADRRHDPGRLPRQPQRARSSSTA